jgi:S-adenosylmethionine hydrolase
LIGQTVFRPLIALLTDFGTRDPYVGLMKGVIASRCPDAQCIDITHEVAPQDIAEGAYLLRSAYRYFPPHTVFLAVVDPGVGTARRPVAIQTAQGVYVGADNGIFAPTLAEIGQWTAVELQAPGPLSATFHGRDLFAPLAAELANGRPLTSLGLPIKSLSSAAPLRLDRIGPATLEGDVIHLDHFGNIVTSLGPFEWQGRDLVLNHDLIIRAETAQISLGAARLNAIRATYDTVPPGELLALIGSDRQLEIAVNRGSAAALTGARRGDPVQIHFVPQRSE